MPTTGHGLVYPDSSGSTSIWTHVQNLADSVETALDTYETFTSWTPTFDTSGSAGGFLTYGSGGVAEGFYQQIGKLVHAQFRIEIQSGFTLDTGVFVLVLPVPAYNSWGGLGTHPAIGSWLARDNSLVDYWGGTISADDTSGDSCTFAGAWTGSVPNRRITDALPFTWAVSDSLTGVLHYRAA